MKLEGDCSYEQSLAFLSWLPPERRERVKRLRSESQQKRHIYAGAFLQQMLSRETGLPMEALSYHYGPWGKPELSNVPLFFNLSHSGDYVVLAVGDQPVGVDVEHKTKNALAVAKRCFTPGEYERILHAGDAAAQQRTFLRYWTGKEAYVKWTGQGLGIPLSSFELVEADTSMAYTGMEPVWLRTHWLEEYCVCVCSREKTALETLSVERVCLHAQ
jgi:4'-phosphopantetheinyl transferase